MKLFRDLNEQEAQVFRDWARKNYKPLTPINGVWHPVVQDECRKMNEEAGSAIDERTLLPKSFVKTALAQMKREHTCAGCQKPIPGATWRSQVYPESALCGDCYEQVERDGFLPNLTK